MNTASPAYADVIRDFCAAAGIAEVDDVLESQHITVSDRLIGLIPIESNETPMLSVCIELGQTYPERDAHVYERLLAANLDAGIAMKGHYAIHHESKQAACHL